MKCTDDLRIPAEWEETEYILLTMPEADTDWGYMLEEVRGCYRELILTMTKAGEHVVLLCKDTDAAADLLRAADSNLLTIVEADYNDTWIRDYGPLTADRQGRRRALDFGFNGWGLKFAADRDNLVNLRLSEKGIINPEAYRNERDFILEGGSIESDGRGTLLTTSRCLCSPNRNGGKSKSQLNEILRDRLGFDHILWLDYGALEGDDTDSHIDTLARLAPADTIIFTGCRDMDDPHFEELLKMRAQLTMFRTKCGEPFNLIELPLPSPIYDEEGCRLPATYANYLVTERNIFIPSYGQPQNDMLAAMTVKVAFPGHEIYQTDCRPLIRQHGSLHCATMQTGRGIRPHPIKNVDAGVAASGHI